MENTRKLCRDRIDAAGPVLVDRMSQRDESWTEAESSGAILNQRPPDELDSSEGYTGRFSLLGRLGLEKLGRGKSRHPRDQVIGKPLEPGVIRSDSIVERLAGKGDLILSRGQLFLEGQHVLVCLEVGISLRQREEPAE